MSEQFSYIGSELELFARAKNWKSYFSSILASYLHGDILEVGAGIGATTEALAAIQRKSWTCLEPDARLLEQLTQKLSDKLPALKARTFCGTTESLPSKNKFDTIIYIDVLEHIEEDLNELSRAVKLLRAGGKIVVLSPAHQWLYSPFDKEIGHFRRYNRHSLSAATPPSLQPPKVLYLDSAGLIASTANRLLLKQKLPTTAQIAFWDGYLVPISRIFDPFLLHSIGKSIVAVWELESNEANFYAA